MLLPMLVALAASQARGPPTDPQAIASAPDADASNLLCKAPGPNASRAQPAPDAMTSVAKNFFDSDLAVAASKSNTSDGDKHADAVKYDIEFDPFRGRCKRASQSLQRQCDAGPQTFAPAVAPPRSWKEIASAAASAQPGAATVNRSASPLLSAPFWAGCAGGLLMRDLDDHEEGDIDSLAKLDAHRAGPQMPLQEKCALFSCLALHPDRSIGRYRSSDCRLGRRSFGGRAAGRPQFRCVRGRFVGWIPSLKYPLPLSRYGNPANESRRERELRCAPLPKPNLCPQIFTRGRPPPGTDDHGCATLRALGLNDHGCSVRTAPVAIGPPDADSPSCIARLRSACSRSASLWPPPLLQLASDFGAGLPHATTEALTIAGPAFERRDASFAGGWGSARRASSRPPVGSIGCGCGLRLHHAGKTVRPQRGHGSRWRA